MFTSAQIPSWEKSHLRQALYQHMYGYTHPPCIVFSPTARETLSIIIIIIIIKINHHVNPATIIIIMICIFIDNKT